MSERGVDEATDAKTERLIRSPHGQPRGAWHQSERLGWAGDPDIPKADQPQTPRASEPGGIRTGVCPPLGGELSTQLPRRAPWLLAWGHGPTFVECP